MTQTLLPQFPGGGRHVNHDLRSLAFPARELTAGRDGLRSKTWRRGGAYDQGRTSWCVAETGKGVLNTSPLSLGLPWGKRSAIDPEWLYRGSQANDEWDGDAYDGTSGLGFCRFALSQGLIREYRWCFSIADYLGALSWVGPVGIGVTWLTGMDEPGERGLIRASGSVRGGHEVELIGIDLDREEVVGMNSWGRSWGDRGRFRLSFADLDRLRQDGADGFVVLR